MIRYLTYSELIFINGRLLNDQKIQAGKQKIRDIDLRLAAEQRPQASAFGADAYETLADKAAALLHALARNHPFKDGNKRTATVALILFCEVNGWRVAWDQAQALTHILDIAEGRSDWPDFAAWLPLEPGAEPAPEADAAADTARIDRILHEQKWLLHELEQR